MVPFECLGEGVGSVGCVGARVGDRDRTVVREKFIGFDHAFGSR